MLKQLAHCVAALHLRERSTEAIDISEKVAAALITRHRYMEAEKLYRNMISLLLSTPEDRFVLWHYNRTKLETLVASFALILENNGEVAAAIELYEDLFAFWDKSSPGYIRGLDQATPHIIRLYRQFSVELTLKPDDCFLPLHRALELRSPALANAILDSKYPTDGRNFKEQTALHLVAKTNEPGKEKHFLALANRLLDGGCDLEARDNEDRTPLFIASQYGAVQMVSLLLEKGASPSELGNYSSSRWVEPIPMTSLHVASICGHESVALHLLYEIPSIDDFQGLNEVLYYASKSGLYDAVTLLLEMGVDVDTTWKWRFYPNPNNLLVFENALSCAVYGGYRALAELLLCKSARSVAEYSGLFGFAIEGKNDQILRWLLTINANYDEHYIIYDEEEEEGEDDEYRYPETALQHACRTGWIRGVQILLQARVDSNQAPHEQEGRTALQAACENGHETIVRMLLNAGSTVYDHLSKKQHGLTALQAASKNGHDQIVGLLLEAGFPLEMYSSSDEEGECWRNTTALQLACGAGHEIVVRLLVKAGANINAPPPPLEFGKTALQAACSGGQGSIVRLLLQLGADINAPPAAKSGTTALQAACNSGHKSIAKLLLEYGADINAPPAAKDGLTALQAACWGGRESIVKLLLQLGADVNAHPAAEDGMTALQAACRGGYESIVKLLLQSGADINAPLVTKDGGTALQAACRCGHISIVKLLLQLEADANAPPAVAYGMTALQAACYSGNESIVKLLLQLGADVNALPAAEYGKTALQVACYCGHESIVKLLLQLGADINAPPVARGGRTALQAACWGGHEPVTKLLLQFGADVNAPPAANNGDSALQAACFRGHESIAKLLLQFGADVNAPPAAHFGQTALQAAKYYACTCGGKSVSSLVKLLKNAGAIK